MKNFPDELHCESECLLAWRRNRKGTAFPQPFPFLVTFLLHPAEHAFNWLCVYVYISIYKYKSFHIYLFINVCSEFRVQWTAGFQFSKLVDSSFCGGAGIGHLSWIESFGLEKLPKLPKAKTKKTTTFHHHQRDTLKVPGVVITVWFHCETVSAFSCGGESRRGRRFRSPFNSSPMV